MKITSGHAAPQWLNIVYRPYVPGLITMLGIALAWYVRMLYMSQSSADGQTAASWVNYLRQYGITHAYNEKFFNIAPFYAYLLGLFNAVFPSISNLSAVKYVSFIGEAFAGLGVYRVMKLGDTTGHSFKPLLCALTLLLMPVVIMNSAVQGQCDIWLTVFLLPMIYFIITGRATAALVCFGLAFAFKPQAIFLLPCLLLYVLKGLIPWKKLWIIPAVYIATCVPCWLEGEPFLAPLLPYAKRLVIDKRHYYTAANLYFFLNEYHYGIYVSGILVANVTACALTWLTYRRSGDTSLPLLHFILLATLFATLMPFLLPKMYDRYFFIADVLSFMLAFLNPRWCMIAVLIQCSSVLASEHSHLLHALAVSLNIVALALLFWLCQRNIWTKPLKIATEVA